MTFFSEGIRLAGPSGVARAGDEAEGGIPLVSSAGNARLAGVGIGGAIAVLLEVGEDGTEGVASADGGVDLRRSARAVGRGGTGTGGGGGGGSPER